MKHICDFIPLSSIVASARIARMYGQYYGFRPYMAWTYSLADIAAFANSLRK